MISIFIFFISILRIFLAAKIATGEALMFLDSHVEVLNGWLLYLLEEIQKDRLENLYLIQCFILIC